MKPCFIIKEIPFNLRNGCALKLRNYPRIIELTKFFSGHVYCGIGYQFS